MMSGASEATDATNDDVNDLLKKGKKSKFPTGIKPMLCSLIKEPF